MTNERTIERIFFNPMKAVYLTVCFKIFYDILKKKIYIFKIVYDAHSMYTYLIHKREKKRR